MPRSAVFICVLSAAAMAVSLWPRHVSADPLTLSPVEVRGRRMEPGSAEAEDTAFSTTLDAPTAAAEGGSVAEHLARSVGVQVRQAGGHGDFASVLIRGSSANQVGVFLDGIPLSQGRGGFFDLSLLPLMSLKRVEVFRGYVPAEFGSEGIGGAINLVPGDPPRRSTTRLISGIGSFGFNQMGISHGARHGRLHYNMNLGVQSAQNDFRFFSDNDTPYQTGDDGFLTRKNNESLLFSAMGLARWRQSKDFVITLLESFQLKNKGLPGAGAAQALQAHYQSMHQVLDIKLDRRSFLHPSLSGMLRFNLQAARERFRDTLGELALGSRNQIDESLTLGAIGRLSWSPHEHQIISLVPEWRFQHYHGSDPGRSLPEARRYRFGLALRDRITLFGDRLGMTPVVRLDCLYNDVTGNTSTKEALGNTYDFFVSPRIGVRYKVIEEITVRGNVGRYFRPPSLFELYGDSGTAMGNPELSPETGLSGDVGTSVTLSKKTRWLTRLLFEGVFFGRRSDNLIAWVQNSQRTAIAMNISQAVALGAELTMGAWIRPHSDWRVRAMANYTFLLTENRSGKPLLDGNRLPGRPLHEANGRLDLAWRRGRVGVGVHFALTHVSDSYLDEANLFLPVPRRTLCELGLAVQPWIHGLTLTAVFKNIGNVQVEYVDAPRFTGLSRVRRALSDFGGFPLPGFQFFVTATWTIGKPKKQEKGEDPA